MDITEQERAALVQSRRLIQFAAESKNGLPANVVADLEAAWEIADSGKWTPQLAASFWLAYDALNSHLRPITIDSIDATTPTRTRRVRWPGSSPQTSLARQTANVYLTVLLVCLGLVMFVAFVASTAESYLKKLDDLSSDGDRRIRSLRTQFAAIPGEVYLASSLNDEALSATSKKWVSDIRSDLQDMYYVADQLYSKVNSLSFVLMGVDPYRRCPDADSKVVVIDNAAHSEGIRESQGCYYQGNLSDPQFKESIAGNIEDFYRTRREVSYRRDQADTCLSVLKVYVLPALLGLLGGCVFVVRLISEQIRDLTFTSTSPIRHLVRVVIGSLAGVVVVMGGFLATAGLSTLALSFLAGYATEAVFSTIDLFASRLKP